MKEVQPVKVELVNCRIGSLEKFHPQHGCQPSVNCRIGSLEMQETENFDMDLVNCRIGSLEIVNHDNTSLAFC